MARRRIKPDDDDAGGLDSLLDTMTNVVGILVLVLIATQLGVQQAVTKAIDVDKLVSDEDLEAKRQDLTLSQEQLALIRRQLESTAPEDAAEVELKLADLRRKADEKRQTLEVEKVKSNTFAMKIADDKKLADEARKKLKQIEDNAANRERVSSQLGVALDEEAKLKAAMDDTPVANAVPAKVVTLPDPKPAPEGAKRLMFVCVYNKVYPIQEDFFREPIKQQCEALCEGIVQDGVVDKEKFFERVRKVQKTWKDENCTVEVFARGIHLWMKFTPKTFDRAGADVKEVENARSGFRKDLQKVDSSGYWAKFLVYPDSFDVYLSARAALEKQNLLAGWEPRELPNEGQVVSVDSWLGSKVVFGKKPPPKPVDPNAPRTKPKKKNEID